jgi:hypothetical protein
MEPRLAKTTITIGTLVSRRASTAMARAGEGSGVELSATARSSVTERAARGLGGVGCEQPGMAYGLGAAQESPQPLGVADVLGDEQHLEGTLRLAAELVQVRLFELAPHVRQIG